MIGRYAFSVVIGVVVTLSLLFVMHLLIASGREALTKPRERLNLDFVRVKRNESLALEDFTPEKPPKPPETPPETPPQDMDNMNPDAPTITTNEMLVIVMEAAKAAGVSNVAIATDSN